MLPFSSAMLAINIKLIQRMFNKNGVNFKILTNQTANSFCVLVLGLIVCLRFKIH